MHARTPAATATQLFVHVGWLGKRERETHLCSTCAPSHTDQCPTAKRTVRESGEESLLSSSAATANRTVCYENFNFVGLQQKLQVSKSRKFERKKVLFSDDRTMVEVISALIIKHSRRRIRFCCFFLLLHDAKNFCHS